MSFTAAAILYLALWGRILWQQRPNFSTNMAWTLEPRRGNLRSTPGRILDLPMTFLFTPMSGKAEVSRYFGNYSKVHDWHLAPGLVEGRPAILVFDSDRPSARPAYFMLLQWSADKVAAIVYSATIENCGDCWVTVHLDGQHGAFHGMNPELGSAMFGDPRSNVASTLARRTRR